MVQVLREWEVMPDKLENGIREYMMRAEEREELYEFIPRYVWKVYRDTFTVRELRRMTGCSFLDFLIRSGDIAYVIALVKNGRDVWDQTVQMKALGAAAHKEKEKKLRPLFDSGIGKRRSKVNICEVRRALSISNGLRLSG